MKRPLGIALVVVGLAFLVVVALLLTDQAVVRAPEDLRSVAFGRPFPWLVQDQPRDPPLPWMLSPMTPQQAVTGVRLAPLLASWAVCAAVLAPVALLVARRMERRRSS